MQETHDAKIGDSGREGYENTGRALLSISQVPMGLT